MDQTVDIGFAKGIIDDALDEISKFGWTQTELSAEDALNAGANATVNQSVSSEVLKAEADAHRERVRQMCRIVAATFGVKLGSRLCGQPNFNEFKKWIAGEEFPNEWQIKSLRHVSEITQIMGLRFSKETVKDWWFSRNDYLAGYTPADMMNLDATAVKMAAMEFVMSSA